MLRLLAGGALIDRGITVIGVEAHTGIMPQIAGAAAGVLILGGLWTPVVGVLAGMVEMWMAFTDPSALPSTILLAGLGFSLAMIGPGAWSIDARLYGRKQILPLEP